MAHVGIVIISHSSKVAEGISDIILQVVHNVPIAVAGGTDTDGIGTDLTKILTAIDQVDEGVGVLLFYDLGSARMNAEVAIDFSENKEVKLVEAPLLESAYVAAVESGIGKSMTEILQTIEASV